MTLYEHITDNGCVFLFKELENQMILIKTQIINQIHEKNWKFSVSYDYMHGKIYFLQFYHIFTSEFILETYELGAWKVLNDSDKEEYKLTKLFKNLFSRVIIIIS